jgi:hypothetical protein
MGTAVATMNAPARIAALTLVFIFSSFSNEFTRIISNRHANAEKNHNDLNLHHFFLGVR